MLQQNVTAAKALMGPPQQYWGTLCANSFSQSIRLYEVARWLDPVFVARQTQPADGSSVVKIDILLQSLPVNWLPANVRVDLVSQFPQFIVEMNQNTEVPEDTVDGGKTRFGLCEWWHRRSLDGQIPAWCLLFQMFLVAQPHSASVNACSPCSRVQLMRSSTICCRICWSCTRSERTTHARDEFSPTLFFPISIFSLVLYFKTLEL